MSRTLYPIVQAPVLTQAQEPEQVTESRWHQPWSEPVQTRIKGYAIALIASGAVISPFALTQPEAVLESKWHQPWSEPVRVKPRLHAALNPAKFDNPKFFAENSVDRWFAWLSEPVRKRPAIQTGDQQPLQEEPFPEVSFSWFNRLSEPVRYRVFNTSLQQAFTTSPFPFVRFGPLIEDTNFTKRKEKKRKKWDDQRIRDEETARLKLRGSIYDAIHPPFPNIQFKVDWEPFKPAPNVSELASVIAQTQQKLADQKRVDEARKAEMAEEDEIAMLLKGVNIG